jgi:hypothetical protein
VGVFAELDDERLTVAAEDDDKELADAAEAHVLVRAALPHPELLDSTAFDEVGSPLSDTAVTAGPLHHVAHDALIILGADPVQTAADTAHLTKTAALVLPRCTLSKPSESTIPIPKPTRTTISTPRSNNSSPPQATPAAASDKPAVSSH